MNTNTINHEQIAVMPANTQTVHRPASGHILHPWGAIYVTLWGTTEIKLNDSPVRIAPWHYVQWIPSGVEHECVNAEAYNNHFIRIADSLVEQMPAQPCIIEMDKLALALVSYLMNCGSVDTSLHRNMLIQTLLIQLLSEGRRYDNYLPLSKDKLLGPILEVLIDNPGDKRSLMQFAQTVHTSEKTLIRRFRSELSLSFREWRSRLRFLEALNLLAGSLSIAEIAHQLGYRHTSSFIFTFHKMTGTTPDNYRKKIPVRHNQNH